MASEKVTAGCFGVGSAKALPQPEKPGHQRRKSWFSRRQAAEEAQPPALDAADPDDKLCEGLFDLDLADDAGNGKARKGDKPAAASLHRRRWSFGARQVAPQPSQPSDAAPEPASDLLASSSDLSVTDSGSPQSAAGAAAAAAAAAALGRPSPSVAASPSPVAAAAPSPQRSAGSYRRLWHSITSVRKGDALPATSAAPGGDVSVESLVKAVQRLRSGQPAIEAVKGGLRHLDSRAVAALLKELSKCGLPHRAAELFDWLRALPPDHPLSKLADLYTYTTIISQVCGGGWARIGKGGAGPA